jgi:hypothetical protein
MPDTTGLLRGRMDRSYQEQTWAVALVVGLNALVLGHRASIVTVLGTAVATWFIATIGGLATMFVWLRHGIYLYYDRLVQQRAALDADLAIAPRTRLLRAARIVALWSGVVFYSLITLGLTLASVAVLRS